MQIGGGAVGPLDMVVGEKVGSAINAWMTLPAADVLGKLALRALSSSPSLPLILWAGWEGGGGTDEDIDWENRPIKPSVAAKFCAKSKLFVRYCCRLE